MFYKLANSGVMGKLLCVIRKFYSNVKSCVKFKSEISEFFSFTGEIMQGKTLSPFIFSFYICDFESDLFKSLYEPTKTKKKSSFRLINADDTVFCLNLRRFFTIS